MFPTSSTSSGSALVRRRYGSESEQHGQEDSYVIRASKVRQGTNATTAESSGSFYDNGDTMMSSSAAAGSMSNSSRDRTGEFASAVRSLQGRQHLNGAPPGGPTPSSSSARRAQLSRQAGEFMTIARSIGRDIHATYAKLEKLTLLARRKTLFDDRPQEIQRLTVIIKDDMNALNKQIGRLQMIAKAQRNQGLQGSNQKSHSSNVVVALQSKLATMTSSFKEVLEVRTENLKESKNRQEMFGQGQVTSSLPQSAIKGFHSGSVLAAASAEDDDRNGGDVAISFGGDPGNQMALMSDQTDEYLQSRADAMINIESTIVELGGIFSQLAHMIKEQEEIMVRIDSNVEDTAMNVEAGHGELLKYFQSVTSNRWLMVKVFGVLIFFFIFFVIFMA